MTSRQKMILRFVGGGVVLVAAIAAWATSGQWASSAQDDPDQRQRVMPVAVTRIVKSDRFELQRSYAGIIRPAQESKLGFEIGGRVEEVFVVDGQVVHQGDLLAKLDQRRLIAQRDQIAAQLESARAQLNQLNFGPRKEVIEAAEARVRDLEARHQLAEIKLDRRRDLVEDNALPQEEFDEQLYQTQSLLAQLQEAQARRNELINGTRPETIDSQEAAVAQLEAALKQANIEIDHSEITAPYDAVVVARRIDPGTIASPGQPIVEIESLSREAWIGCPPDIAKTLEIGSQRDVRVRGADVTETEMVITGSIVNIVPRLEDTTRTQTVILQLGEVADELPTGIVAKVSITQSMPMGGYWLPMNALSPGSHGLWAAYVVSNDEQGRPRANRRDVTLIHVQGDRGFVQGTLDAGDQIVADGVHRISPGQLVDPNS